MKSIRCPHCGLLNWATEESCKRCRLSLLGTEPAADNQPSASQPYEQSYESQQYQNQQYENAPYANQPYENQPYENQPYDSQQYENQYGSQGEQAHGWQYNTGGYAGYQGGPSSYAYPGYAEAQKKTGLAIASMVVGIISFMACGLLGLGTITGLTLGIVALVKAKKRPMEYGVRALPSRA